MEQPQCRPWPFKAPSDESGQEPSQSEEVSMTTLFTSFRRVLPIAAALIAAVVSLMVGAGTAAATSGAVAVQSSAPDGEFISAQSRGAREGTFGTEASGGCQVFLNARLTQWSDMSMTFSSTNSCTGIAPAQTIDLTLLGPTGELAYADNSCGGCQLLGASGAWPGPAVPGTMYTLEISTVLQLTPQEAWVPGSYDSRCTAITPQVLSCQTTLTLVAVDPNG